MKAVLGRLPTTVDTRVKVFAVATLVAQILIVGTGGAVRLTGSGLGCPTWPRCTDDSFVTTPEMGIHGIIEFGNRLLTFVLVIIAIGMFLVVVRMRRERRDLFVLSLLIGLGIPGQAVIGGISVLTNLNPWVVGLHFVLSVVLVVLSTVLVYRVYFGARGTTVTVPLGYALLTYAASILVSITIALGIVTTGAGPHAGDSGASRNSLDPEILQHLHAWPAYGSFLASMLLLIGALRLSSPRLIRFTIILVSTEVAQIAVGLTQARLGLPEILVGIHMVLACCLASAMTAVVLSLRAPESAN